MTQGKIRQYYVCVRIYFCSNGRMGEETLSKTLSLRSLEGDSSVKSIDEGRRAKDGMHQRWSSSTKKASTSPSSSSWYILPSWDGSGLLFSPLSAFGASREPYPESGIWPEAVDGDSSPRPAEDKGWCGYWRFSMMEGGAGCGGDIRSPQKLFKR